MCSEMCGQIGQSRRNCTCGDKGGEGERKEKIWEGERGRKENQGDCRGGHTHICTVHAHTCTCVVYAHSVHACVSMLHTMSYYMCI